MSKLKTTFSSLRKLGKLCACCPAVASHVMTDQQTWFRGDDEVLTMCPECLFIAQSGLLGLKEIYIKRDVEKQRRRDMATRNTGNKL